MRRPSVEIQPFISMALPSNQSSRGECASSVCIIVSFFLLLTARPSIPAAWVIITFKPVITLHYTQCRVINLMLILWFLSFHFIWPRGKLYFFFFFWIYYSWMDRWNSFNEINDVVENGSLQIEIIYFFFLLNIFINILRYTLDIEFNYDLCSSNVQI